MPWWAAGLPSSRLFGQLMPSDRGQDPEVFTVLFTKFGSSWKNGGGRSGLDGHRDRPVRDQE
jgi:hypothetical protein